MWGDGDVGKVGVRGVDVGIVGGGSLEGLSAGGVHHVLEAAKGGGVKSWNVSPFIFVIVIHVVV